jgi:Bacteriophage T4, Gp8
MANVCDKFRQNFKQTFIDRFAMMFDNLSTDKWFLSIGKPLPWISNAGEIDNLPPAVQDTEQAEIEFWQNAIAHKRITQDDISIVIPRYDWTIGAVYSPFRPDVELFNTVNPYIFYVLVDEERVYKCIDNNYGAPSTIAPTHTDTNVKTLSDGYRWKYMYSITENRRKFLLKSGLKTGGTIRPGYMPVENLETLGINDERYLQFAVQNAAVDGEIVFIYFLPEYANYLISDRCIFASSGNLVVSNVSSGGLTATLYSSGLAPIPNYYNNMVLSIDSGQGQGQRRIISTYAPQGASANYATVEVTNPFTVGLLGAVTTFSIVPNVTLDGDGDSLNNTLDPLRTIADVSVSFNPSSTGNYRYVNSFEMVDTGQNYTFANLKVIAGLTFAPNTPAALITDFANVATPIVSPQGGHGSNPVAELGGNALMIVKKYTGSENGKITSQNEFRQFGIIKNPDLAQPQVRLSTVQAGNAASFTVGSIATQSATGTYGGATGTVVSWTPGLTGYTGTSELVLTNVAGIFTSAVQGAVVGSSLDVFDVSTRTRAGTEGRDLLVLTVTPTTATTFSTSANDFPKGMYAVGLGNASQNIEFSGSKGRIYRWDAVSGLNNQGKIYLENAYGTFNIGETVGVRDRYMTFYSGLTGKAKIVEKTQVVESIPAVYSQVYKFVMSPAGGDTFVSGSFVLDNTVYAYSGSSQVAAGKVINWNTSGATGDLSLILSTGQIAAGNTIAYTNSAGAVASSLVTAISQSPELKYRSGQVQYIQNMRPIVRSDSQEEEIKLVIEI